MSIPDLPPITLLHDIKPCDIFLLNTFNNVEEQSMNKEEKLRITKEKLMEAALQLMENTDNPMEVTSRQIAAKAEVQPGMINYCFGSRENLIYSVFSRLYNSFLSDADVESLLKSDLPPKELLKELHFIVAKCLIEQYNFTKAITAFVLFKRDLSQESFSFPYIKKHYNGRKSDEKCRIIAYELSTMMQLIIFRKDEIQEAWGLDLHDEKVLKSVIDMRIDLLLGE